jgi:hypothetical protein
VTQTENFKEVMRNKEKEEGKVKRKREMFI